MELIIVLIVLAIIGAVMIPSMVGFIWHGQQINRMNVARTLYISMQNQLTRHVLEGNLREVLTSHFYIPDPDNPGNLIIAPAIDTVADELGDLYPPADNENRDYVFPISIPRDYVALPAGHPNRTVEDDFYHLLDSIIINKDLLSDTFLMELNIRTGVILSIFYGDDIGRARQEEFDYTGDDTNIDVVGGRGMGAGGYQFDYDRAQGYYGVDWTGEPAFVHLPELIDIYDGKNSGRSLDGRYNVLYAELFIPQNTDSSEFRFDLVSDRARQSVLNPSLNSSNPLNPTGFYFDLEDINTSAGDIDEALEGFMSGLDEHLIYLPTDQSFELYSFGIDMSGLYNKYIWVLDCVYGDQLNPNPLTNPLTNHSISKYIDTEVPGAYPQFIRASITRIGVADDGIEVISLTTDHSHYGGELSGDERYIVSSARHLSNIREFTGAEFRQTEDIYIANLYNGIDIGTAFPFPDAVTNFKPIENFSGTFIGSGPQRVLNLNIAVAASAGMTNIGLFANITGTEDRLAEVRGLSIHRANIGTLGNSNVGAIAGLMGDYSRVSQSYSYANVIGGSTADCNTGGLVGEIRSATAILEQSFNAGFFDTNPGEEGGSLRTKTQPELPFEFNSALNNIDTFGSVRATGGNIGGLVGKNNGTIQDSFNNARVNIEDVSHDEQNLVDLSGQDLRLDEYLISVDLGTDGNTGLDDEAVLGGIVGENTATGRVDRTYATNFVAIYSNTSNSGGIAGQNDGAIDNSIFLNNGCNNGEGEAVSKEELTNSQDNVLGAMFEESDIDYIDYLELEGFNEYSNYPYPTLINNPILMYNDEDEDYIWGWEEILGEPVISLAALAYYEITSDNIKRHSSRFLTQTIVPAGSPLHVIHDGYSIEFFPNIYGYLLRIGEGTAKDTFYKIVEQNDVWRIFVFDDDEEDWIVDEEWMPAEAFTPNRNLPDYYDEEDMLRIYIPNHLAFDFVNSPVPITLYPGAETPVIAGVVQAENELGDALTDTGLITDYVPLFANFSRPALNASIRSPRHLVNINYANSGASPISGTYTQHLNIDFELNYYDELRFNLGQFTTLPPARLKTFNQAVVSRTFEGVYNGNSRVISNLTINALVTTNNIGLFSINDGVIRNATLRNASFQGGENTGGIAGTNTGLIEFCSLQTIVMIPNSAADPAFTVRGTNNVGGIAGINSGTVSNVYFVSNSANTAVQGVTNVGGIVGDNQNTATRLLYLARLQTVRLAGAGTVTDGYYLCRLTTTDRYSLNHLNFISGDYNGFTAQEPADGSLGLKTIDIFESVISSWVGWTRAAVPADGLGAITEVDLLTNERNRIIPYAYPYFMNGAPTPTRWPLVGSLAQAMPARMAYYERYYGTDYVGLWYNQNEDYLLYPNDHAMLQAVGLAGRPLYVIEEGYVVTALTGAFGQNNDNITMRTRAGVALMTGENNGLTITNIELIPGVNFFAIGMPNDPARNQEFLTDGLDLIYFILNIPSLNVNIDGWLNALYAKAIYPGTSYPTAANGYIEGRYSIRSPRHLENIINTQTRTGAGKTGANGTFVQEIDINLDVTTDLADRTRYSKFFYTPRNGGGFHTFSPALYFAQSATTYPSIVNGNFTGSYTGTYDHGYGPYTSRLFGLNLTKSNAGGVSIFQTVSGTVENVRLENNIIRNNGTGNAGGLAAANAGTILNISVINSTVATTSGRAGGIAGTNTVTISNVFYITNGDASPVSATNSDTNAGGIAATNSGTISNVLYLAPAPVENPISQSNTGNITNAFYLSGSVSASNRPTQTVITVPPPPVIPYNNFNATNGGQPRTSQEIRALSLSAANGWTNAWTPAGTGSIPILTYANYHYAYMYSEPLAWPVATIPASSLAYYEIYSDGTMGFSPNHTGEPGFDLVDNLPIDVSGYCAVVSRPGIYSVKQGAGGSNTLVSSITATSNITSVNYVILNNTLGVSIINSGTAYNAVEVYINDLQISDTDRFINTLFAQGIYANANPTGFVIRTPRQMQNIGYWTAAASTRTTGVTFTQNRDIDFAEDVGGRRLYNNNYVPLTSSVVTGNFLGTYDGGGFMISNVAIESSTPNVGLFSQNSGTIQRLMLVFNEGSGITGAYNGIQYVGSIAGYNMAAGAAPGATPGVISDITVVSTIVDLSDNAIAPVSGTYATAGVGGIVGQNAGDITRILYLAPAPVGSTYIYPIVYADDNTTSSYTYVYYLSGTGNAGIVSSAGLVTTLSSGYNYSGLTANIAQPFNTPGDTNSLNLAIATNWTPTWTSAFTGTINFTTFPYPNIVKTPPALLASLPAAWPVVTTLALPAPAISPLSGDLDSSESDLSTSYDSNTQETEPDGITPDGDNTDSNTTSGRDGSTVPEDDTTTEAAVESPDAVLVAVGAVTLIGGYSFTKTEPFKSLIRKSNARAVRRINEYNARKKERRR